MHEGMNPSLDKDETTCQFVEVDVVIKRKDARQAHVTEEGDGVAEDKTENEDRVEQ